jgi:hypothetical protein
MVRIDRKVIDADGMLASFPIPENAPKLLGQDTTSIRNTPD